LCFIAISSASERQARAILFKFKLEDLRGSVENATFRKWLAEHGCRFDTQLEARRQGHGMVTIHLTAKLPLVGARHNFDPRTVRQVCEMLGLDCSNLPGPKGSVRGRLTQFLRLLRDFARHWQHFLSRKHADVLWLKFNSREATNDLLLVQNDPAGLGLRTNDD
jgi:hypothetical protein